MRVALVQHDIHWEDPAATAARVAPLVATAAGAGAALVVLTEMWSTGFSMAAERIAEAPDGPSTTFLAEQASHHGLHLCASVPTADPTLDRPVNRLVVAAPDGRQWHYDKRHPFTFAGEHHHYDAGDDFLTLTIDGVRCSFFVCYDLRFGDDWWRRAGATDCYVVVASWPEARRRHWQVLAQARAIENQAFVVAANRVGTDANGITYAGDSAVIDPMGEVLASAAGIETVVLAEVDPATVAGVRASFPFLQDRRTFPVVSGE